MKKEKREKEREGGKKGRKTKKDEEKKRLYKILCTWLIVTHEKSVVNSRELHLQRSRWKKYIMVKNYYILVKYYMLSEF